jgi:hypothetical protein
MSRGWKANDRVMLSACEIHQRNPVEQKHEFVFRMTCCDDLQGFVCEPTNLQVYLAAAAVC